ncbi:flagellar operon protein [Selenomonas artemidis F0399]|uniref:Flagellar operon protein n=2 Tax=Selenomonadaceae TaxID=1843491 RepID=E7N0V8_9FIRM|nr:flagellar operon protein [Selenomonas artemidis F0399]
MPQDLRGKTEERGDARTSFADVLAASERRVNFSRHAVRRLEEREIVLSPQELERLDGMVDRMAAKGARQALILMNDTAFVLAVPKRTVITVLDGEHAKDNIFTNIDSAAIL